MVVQLGHVPHVAGVRQVLQTPQDTLRTRALCAGNYTCCLVVEVETS